MGGDGAVRRLPQVLVLAPYRRLLHRGERVLQLGLDPSCAVEIGELSPGLARLVAELRHPRPTADLLAQACGWGVEAAEAFALLAELVAAGAVVDAVALQRSNRLRRAARVVVYGDGPLAAAVAAALTAAGVGTVQRCGPATVPARRALPDLAVLADDLVAPPEHVSALVTLRVAHLPVRLRDGVGLVGPLVLPGRTSCLRCLELHRAARDRRWPLVAAQLVGRPGFASAGCTAATAALAADQALAALSQPHGQEPPPTVDAVLELDTWRGRIRRRIVPAHPGCGCRDAVAG